MFNLQGSEIIFILLIALVVLGPEKLPGAIRRITSLYTELRKMSTGFQDEFRSVLDEPMREMKSTADLMKGAADPKRIAEEAEREAEMQAAAEKKAQQARDTTAAMEAAGAAHLAAASADSDDLDTTVDAFADPIDEAVAQPDVAEPERATAEVDAADEPEPVRANTSVDEPPATPRLSSVDLGDDEPEEKSA